MADTLRVKRRAAGGAAGAPAALAAAEIAFNEQDNVLYYGAGNSAGAATSIFPIAGPGAFLPKSGGAMTGGINFGSVVDSGNNSVALHLSLYSTTYGLGVTGSRLNYNAGPAASHVFLVNGVDVAAVSPTGFQGPHGATTPNTGAFTTLSASGTVSGGGFISLLAPYAPLASPVFTGTPSLPTGTTAVTQAPAVADTTLATTAFVSAAVSASQALVTISDTAPSSPAAGRLWFDSVNSRLYIYFTDANSSQWVGIG